MTPSTISIRILEEKPTMSIPNRLTLDAVPTTPIGEIAALPAEQLALLQQEAAEALAKAKRLKDWLDSSIDLKYRDQAAALRRSSGKDTGTVRIEDGDVVVVADLPKRVKWEQARLAGIVERIRAGGDDPAEYVTVEFAVSERAYGAWPNTIRAAFEPARTVETGKPSYRLEKIKGGL
jgi:hypothetical protein